MEEENRYEKEGRGGLKVYRSFETGNLEAVLKFDTKEIENLI
jgi:hypothetical protein